jgi:sensor histidine kinase YesM
VAKAHFWVAPNAISNRLSTLIVTIACYYLYHFVAGKIITYFAKENKGKVPVKEYLFVLFVSVFFVTLGTWLGALMPHETEPTWIVLTRNYGLIIPVSIVYYTIMRNYRIAEEYNRQTLQLEKTRSNQFETELKYLRAQYHPHFLFNALNTVYFQIDSQNTNAKNTVELLSELLRYQLYNMEKEVDVSEEINFIKRYIQFQQLRMTNRLAMNVSFDKQLDKQKIYPLIYQPFLENAFKYVGGEYRINLEMKFLNEQIIFQLENSLPEQMQQAKKSNSGIGIENARPRLALLYPDRHQLNIKQDEKSFMVELIISLKNIDNENIP